MKSFLVSVWYRPPSTSKFLRKNFNELLTSTLSLAYAEEKEMILTGDFNCNYLKRNENNDLKSIFTLFQLKQVIKTATRVTLDTETSIYLVFTNTPFNITKNDVFPLSFSDHDLIGFNRKQNRVKTTPKTTRCRNYRQYDHNKLKADLKTTDWSSVYNASSVSESLQAFNDIMTSSFDKHDPYLTKRVNTNVCPWLTAKLKSEMYYRDVLHRKFQKSKSKTNEKAYKRQRNKVNNMIKRCKQNFNRNILQENTNNPTAFWKSLKKIYPTKPKSQQSCSSFLIDGKDVTDKVTITNEFGKFFSNIATKLLRKQIRGNSIKKFQ